MKIAGLLTVLVLAKIAMVLGHHVPLSWWSPIAYLWQDAAIVLLYAACERVLGARRRFMWAAYCVLAAYVAVNIPVARVLSTPLTRPMLRAARGALSDSIWHAATWPNLLWMIATLATAMISPRLFRRVPELPVVGVLVLCVALGPSAVRRVDTLGLDRNAWTALLGPASPSVDHNRAAATWRREGFEPGGDRNLSAFKGVAAGRNIVLVSLESTAARYLGLYGADPDVMPNLSRLSQSAIVFDTAYAVYPESIKGLFSILCSSYPSFGSAADVYADVPCSSVAGVLSHHGYRTALFHSGRFDYLGMNAVIRDRGYDLLADAGDIGGHHDSSFGVDEPSTVSSVLNWLDKLPHEQPFFLTYLPIAGHHPYETSEPGPFAERTDFDRYRNALHEGDTALGRLMDGLRTRGLEQRTLWIVLGDHGEAFGQHDGNYGHTFFLYDENVHVPLMVAVPGALTQSTRSRRVVSLVDTAPTLLDLVGLAAPDTYQGRSALDPGPRMALFFADYSLGLLGLRDGRMKFIYDTGSGRAKLFDMETDPDEKADQSERYPERTRWYREDLERWRAAGEQRVNAVASLR